MSRSSNYFEPKPSMSCPQHTLQDPIWSHVNAVHTLTIYFCKIPVCVVLPSTPTSSLLMFSDQHFVAYSFLICPHIGSVQDLRYPNILSVCRALAQNLTILPCIRGPLVSIFSRSPSVLTEIFLSFSIQMTQYLKLGLDGLVSRRV